MRRVFNASVRGVAAVAVIVVVSASAVAAPRENVDRDRSNPIVKTVKRVLQALGDGLTILWPKP